jgi:3-hydroxyisobutyrate dehydrogenase-like beta-hydroxyacid dehydrogenase
MKRRRRNQDGTWNVSFLGRLGLSCPLGFNHICFAASWFLEGMAARLLSEGVAGSDDSPLIIWNRTKSKCTELQSKFSDKKVLIKDTAKEVIEASAVTFSILSTPEASRLVFEGPNGVLAGVSAGKSIVDCATLAEEDMQRMSEAVTSKGG